MNGLTQGTVIGGRYELGGVIGRGGMADVHAARDVRLHRDVAVKMLRPELAGQATVRRRFEREARAAARLTHRNVVAVHDVGEDGDVPYIVMELVDGPPLQAAMAAGPMRGNDVRRIGIEILDALGAAHAAGVVHRDIKPGNVLLSGDGSVKVADFGIAKAAGDPTETADLDLTAAGELVGTVGYMAPERLAGQAATVRSDVYSVGVILYEALSGTRPFKGDTPMAVAHAVQTARPEPLLRLRPDLDPGLVAIVERAMAPRPDDRFATTADMAAALRCGAAPSETALIATVAAAAPTCILPAAPLSPPGPPSAPAAGDSGLVSTTRGGSAAAFAGNGAGGDRHGRRRGWLLVAAVIAGAFAAPIGLAAWGGIGDSRSGATPGSGVAPASAPATRPAPAAGNELPVPLADALDELEETVR